MIFEKIAWRSQIEIFLAQGVATDLTLRGIVNDVADDIDLPVRKLDPSGIAEVRSRTPIIIDRKDPRMGLPAVRGQAGFDIGERREKVLGRPSAGFASLQESIRDQDTPLCSKPPTGRWQPGSGNFSTALHVRPRSSEVTQTIRV